MTDIYLYFLVSHYGLYANAPVVAVLPSSYHECGQAEQRLARLNGSVLLPAQVAEADAVTYEITKREAAEHVAQKAIAEAKAERRMSWPGAADAKSNPANSLREQLAVRLRVRVQLIGHARNNM